VRSWALNGAAKLCHVEKIRIAEVATRISRHGTRLRIPIYSGRVFRREAGHRSDLKPSTIPK
jgi:hypothetical protein